MRFYGINNFKIELLDTAKTYKELGELERYYISIYKSNNPMFGYNNTSGGESNQLDGNPRAKLTIDDIINIRIMYKNSDIGVKDCWNYFYKDKISYSAFEKIYEGYTWKSIMPEVYTKEIKKLHHQKFKKHIGFKNGNALYTDNEVLEIRKYYENHTLLETYNKYGNKSKNINSFRTLIKKTYKHLPYFDKIKKYWKLNNNIIDITNYNPVSTISGSGE